MLKINLEFRKGILFVRLKGDLTKYTYKCLDKYLLPVINQYGIKFLIYNLEALTLLDNDGKASLKKGVAAAEANQGFGALCNAKITLQNEFRVFDNELMVFAYLQI